MFRHFNKHYVFDIKGRQSIASPPWMISGSWRTHTRWSHNTCGWTRVLEFSHVGTRAVGDTPLVKILSPCDPRKRLKHGDEVTRQLADNYLNVTVVGAIQAFTPEDWTDQMYHEQGCYTFVGGGFEFLQIIIQFLPDIQNIIRGASQK
jgi:hypothetical protein